MTASANRLTERAPAAGDVVTTSATQLRALIDGLERLDYPVAALLADAGIRRADLDDPDAWIPCSVLDRVVCSALEQRRTTNLGARLAAVTPIGTYPLLDYLVVTQDSVGAGLAQLARYFHLTGAPTELVLSEDEDPIRVAVHRAPQPFTAEFISSLMVHHLRNETQGRLRVAFVSLMHQPDDVTDLERQLGCAVQAPASWNGVAFPRDMWRLPLRRREPALRRVLEGHARELSARAPATVDSVSARVRAVLAARLGRGEPSVAAVARQLAVAPRTLQRRLAAEGVSYQQLVDVTRRETAQRLLTDASLAVAEIAYLLGFSEPSAFHRAFKRWVGVTPQEYRTRRRTERGAAAAG
jgi:AraC-like DNA-binding protein